MIDPELVTQVIEMWNAYQEYPHRDILRRPLEDPSVLKDFIEAAFFASLKEEEGQAVSFSAVLAAEDEAMSSDNYRTEIQRLESGVPFNPSCISKIAPALDPKLSSLAVAPHGRGSRLVCWGVFSFTPTANRYDEVPVVVEGGMYFRPDHFTVTSSSPGSLIISRGNSVVGRLSSGYLVPATPEPFRGAEVDSLGRHWKTLVDKNGTWNAHGIDAWNYTTDALRMLLSEASRRGHGATIVVLDAEVQSSASALYSAGHVLGGQQRLGARILGCLEKQQDVSMSLAHRKITAETIQRVAQLAAVDGALILNNNFDVLAFGAKLKAPEWQGPTPMGPDGFGAVEFDVTMFGTRHRAGLDFAGGCQGCIVFVISEDGPIRAFVYEDDSVLCWPDCSTSMSVQ